MITDANYFYLSDLLGTLFFAISGTLSAKRKDIDIFGAAFLGFVTAIGGGSMRDVFLNLRPAWVNDSNYLIAIFLGILIAIIFNRQLYGYYRTLTLFDAIGISFFTILGVQKSLNYESNVYAAIIFGMFTAVCGGMIRDILLNETPLIFKKEVYATACLAGGLIYILLVHLDLDLSWAAFIAAAVVFLIRMTAVKYRLYLPRLD
ncbi:trimeric intracellular cation channel family protein [Sphingobacterium prati]|uniref:trimeric intracellular cation channel family protein n=1 Tax=Sphingobacterium prati TaxID=2737006 RepID=UPI00155434F3|nr:trimeric intracellular cation channel family protein [Sphingobacterium prati]NPE45312.1 trimeric intracellular cation channel family protein [Sphingobacterium prati]